MQALIYKGVYAIAHIPFYLPIVGCFGWLPLAGLG